MTYDERLAIAETKILQNCEDIQDLKSDSKAIYEMATAVKVMATEMQGVSAKVDEIKEDLTEAKKVSNDATENVQKQISKNIADIQKQVDFIKYQPAQQTSENVNKVKVAIYTTIVTLFVSGILSAIISFSK